MSLRILFLCSGGGGNLRFAVEAARLGFLPDAEVAGVITDRDCPAGQFALRNGLPVVSCDFSAEGQTEARETMLAFQPDIIVSNIHKILAPNVLQAFNRKIINLHYSLLPAFGGVIGAKALSLALDYGARLVGTTVHWVDEQVDAGRPLIQAAIPVLENEALTNLMDVVFRVGCISLMAGIEMAKSDSPPAAKDLRSVFEVSERPVLFTSPVGFFPEFQDEAFWRRFK